MRLYTDSMKKWLATLLVYLTAVCMVQAQPSSVTVELSVDQDQYLPGEDIRVAVKITNLSGQELELGTNNSWLSFTVEAFNKRIVEKTGNPEVAGKFKLQSSTSGTKRVNITPHFSLQMPGRYQVSALIRVPQWNIEVSSRPATFDVVRGSKIREIEFGVPTSEGETVSAPEVRKYILQQAEYRKEMKLYLRLTDGYEGKTFKLYPVARMLSFSRPEMHLDRYSNVHVLNRSGQNSFAYCTMNPYGQILNLQRYDYVGNSGPRLALDDQGKVSVTGGARVVTANDLPPSEQPAAVSNAQHP